MELLTALVADIMIPLCAAIGIAYFMFWWFLTLRDNDRLEAKCARIKKVVSEGVVVFLFTEYKRAGVLVVAFGILIFLFLGSVETFSTQSRPCLFDTSNTCKPALATAIFTTFSFLLGASTSALSGLLGMKIDIYVNAWTALEERNGVRRTFFAAFKSGAVMGFLLGGIGLLVLYLAIILFQLYYGNDWEGLFGAITGYGLGGSSMALFGRAAGGIYAKAADVCVHLVKMIDPNIQEDYRNSAVIPNNLGDAVGDIAGVGTDLFGSYAGSSCAALVVASISSLGIDHDFTAMCYALLISSMGIIVCFITTISMAKFFRIEEVEEIKPALHRQLLISTTIMTVGIAIVSWIALPSSFAIYNFGSQKVVKNLHLFSCVCVGLWARPISELVLECYATAPYRSLVQDGAGSFGLAYVIIPISAIAINIIVSFRLAATYGIAVAAIGMLSNIATGLAIDAYGPISHNAGGIAKTAGMSDEIRQSIEALDAAGNSIAAIGKGFAIGSAVLVSVALFGAFVSRAAISSVDFLTAKMVIGLIVGLIMGAILPYWFTATTMKIAGSAGLKMVQEVIPQINLQLEGGWPKPVHDTCVKISTDAAISGTIQPVFLVMLTPLIVGTLFGVETLSGVLIGSLFSVAGIATSAAKTGGAWDKAKEYIKAGASDYATNVDSSTLDPSVVQWLRIIVERGDAIGDERKDTSGPTLYILIQLMAVESLVFAPFFTTHGGLLFKIY